MTTQERLLGICQMITEEIEEDRAYEAVGSSEHVARIATSDGGWAYLYWNEDGVIDVSIKPGSAWLPGSVQDATITAAMWPQGDFQVAETIADWLP